jgi:hypothetical protein
MLALLGLRQFRESVSDHHSQKNIKSSPKRDRLKTLAITAKKGIPTLLAGKRKNFWKTDNPHRTRTKWWRAIYEKLSTKSFLHRLMP